MGRNDRGGDPRRGRLQHLRSFCQAAQLGSISRAAEQVGLSQPSVSLQIQALEQELKVSLFQRRGPRIALTPEGQALYKLAKPMVEAVDGLPALFQACRAGQETGWLNVAAGESTILYILPEPVRRFAGLYPGVELKLHNVTGREGLKQLRGDAVDFAFGSLLEVPADMVYEPTVSYETMLITPIDHPLTKLARVRIQDIARYPLILPPPQLTTWRLVDYAFQKYKLTYRVALEAGGWEVIKRYVAIGLGIAVVTGICLNGQEPLAAIPLSKYFPNRTYGIVHRKGKLLSGPALKLMDLFREHTRAGPKGPGAPTAKRP